MTANQTGDADKTDGPRFSDDREDDGIIAMPPAEFDQDIEDAYMRAMNAIEEAEAWDKTVPSLAEGSTGEGSTGSPAVNQTRPADPAPPQSLPGRQVTPQQVLEALLFVGGSSLTTRRLSQLLRDEFDADFIEEQLAALDARYAAERRPYRIDRREDGFALRIRPEFESVQRKVHGLGPKEVRLSQDALEVLALVAYRQPITKEGIEELKAGCGGPLGQLVRRELVRIERQEGSKTVHYHTTPRFLSLLGLRSLDDLPQADELEFK